LLLATAAFLSLLVAVRLGENRALSMASELAAGDGRPTLLFLFQPGDCQAYAGLVRRWNSIARDSAVRVVGIGIGFDRPRIAGDAVLGEPKPAFPVRYDMTGQARRLLARIGHLATPTSVLLDGSDRPLLIVPPLSDETAQRHAATLVSSYARHVSATASRGAEDAPPRPIEPAKETES
jgi:hypothetical protein